MQYYWVPLLFWAVVCGVFGCRDYVKHDRLKNSVALAGATAVIVFYTGGNVWYIAGYLMYFVGFIFAGIASFIMFNFHHDD